ncbi:hypothetical protein GIB67_012742, partial [Kingdonia uniflora]
MDSMWDVHFYVYALPIEVVPPPLIEKPYVVMMEPDEGPTICHTSQVEVEVETTQFNPLQHESTQFDPLQHETISRGRQKASNDEEEIDEVDTWNRWAETNPDSLDAEEGSGQSNKNANAQWVAKEVKEIIRTMITTRLADVKELISRSLAKYSKDLQSNQWKSSLVIFKASFDRLLSRCRPVLGLGGCFLKGGSRQKSRKKQVQGIISRYFLAIGINGQRWRVNTNTHECDCHEWQLSGLPCVHVVSDILPYGWPWV